MLLLSEKYPKGHAETHLFSYNNPVIQLVQSTILLQVEHGAMQMEQIALIESP